MKMFLLKTTSFYGASPLIIGSIEASSREEAMTKLGLEQRSEVLVFRDREQQQKMLNKDEDYLLEHGLRRLWLDEIRNLSQFAPPRPIAERDPDSHSC